MLYCHIASFCKVMMMMVVKKTFYIVAEMGPVFLHALMDTKSAFTEIEESWFICFGKEEEGVLKWGTTFQLLYRKKKKITDFFLMIAVFFNSLNTTSMQLTESETFWHWCWGKQVSQPSMSDFLQGFLSIPTFFVRFKQFSSGLRKDYSEPVMQLVSTSTFLTSFQNGNTTHLGYTKQHWVKF